MPRLPRKGKFDSRLLQTYVTKMCKRRIATLEMRKVWSKMPKGQKARFEAEKWEKLSAEDRMHAIAESFRRSTARYFPSSYTTNMIIKLVKEHPVKCAEGLGKKNTNVFFYGLGDKVEFLFRALGKDTEKFIKRLLYKDQLAKGASPKALARGIAGNIEDFIRGITKNGKDKSALRFFDVALQYSLKDGRVVRDAARREGFIQALGKSSKHYLQAVEKAKRH